jgi:hypothetical protein
MTATLTDVAEAIKSEIEGGAWSLPATVVREHLPQYTLPQLDSLRISVVPRGSELERLTRGSKTHVCEVDVGVIGKLESLDNAGLDAHVALADEIVSHFHQRQLEAFDNAFCGASRPDPIFDPGVLESNRVFLAVIRITVTVYP